MFISRSRPAVRVPNVLLPALMGVLAITATLAAWAIVSVRPATNSSPYRQPPLVSPALVGSVAYFVADGSVDRLLVRNGDGTGEPRELATFGALAASDTLRARGSASPLADRIAVLSVVFAKGESSLTFLDVRTGRQQMAAASFEPLAPLVWSRDGLRVTTLLADGTTVAVVDSETLATTALANFEGARSVVPVGYSLDGLRLFVVVVDQSGSAVWQIERGHATRVASLSPGLTRDWALSPDGSRLAYVELLGAGDRRYAGRTLMLGKGSIIESLATADELGAAWIPGSNVPAFGGPGGSLQLHPAVPGSYLLPRLWSPDGSRLIAVVVSADDSVPGGSVEVVTSSSRLRLSNDGAARPVGWVIDDR